MVGLLFLSFCVLVLFVIGCLLQVWNWFRFRLVLCLLTWNTAVVVAFGYPWCGRDTLVSVGVLSVFELRVVVVLVVLLRFPAGVLLVMMFGLFMVW